MLLQRLYVKKRRKIPLTLEFLLVKIFMFFWYFFHGNKKIKLTDSKRILVIRSNQLGDAVAASAFISALGDFAQHAEIDVAASKYNKDAFNWIPGVNQIIIEPPGSFRRLLMYWSLRGKYDFVFQTLLDEYHFSKILGARIAAWKGALVMRKRGSPLDSLADYSTWMPIGGYIGKLMALLRPLVGIPVAELIKKYPTHNLIIPKNYMQRAEQSILSKRLARGRYVALNISARESFRSLGISQSIEIAQALNAHGHQVALFYAPSDKERAQQVLTLCPSIHDLSSSELGISMASVGMAALYVGADTGTVHFAAAAGVPSVVIFANRAKPEIWSPYGVPFISIHALTDMKVSQVPVNQVVAAALRLLDGDRSKIIEYANALENFGGPVSDKLVAQP